jgi:hypothetical protein
MIHIQNKEGLIKIFMQSRMNYKTALQMPLDQLIESNTSVTSIMLEFNKSNELTDHLTAITKGLSKNSVLTRLHIKGDRLLCSNISGANNILELYLEIDKLEDLIGLFNSNTKLQTLRIETNHGYDISSYIANHKSLRTLHIGSINYRESREHQYSNLFQAIANNTYITKLIYDDVPTNLVISNSLKHLEIYICLIPPKFLINLVNNTNLETLVDNHYKYGWVSIYDKIFGNTSIINIGHNKPTITIHNWLNRNRSYRWKHINPMIVNYYIGLVSKTFILPPYVLLEIFDWLHQDNPYTKHIMKITLIVSLQKSIKKIWNIV